LWTLQHSIRGIDTGDLTIKHFGWSVSLSASGDTLAVGASSSSVVVFVRDGSGGWTEQSGVIQHTNTAAQFGYTVSLNAAGDALAVGAPLDDAEAPMVGCVYTLTRSAGGVWGPLRLLRPSDSSGVPGTGFGWSVSMSDQGSLVIGAVMEAPTGAWWSVRRTGNGYCGG
jgi:hypothetical protein